MATIMFLSSPKSHSCNCISLKTHGCKACDFFFFAHLYPHILKHLEKKMVQRAAEVICGYIKKTQTQTQNGLSAQWGSSWLCNEHLVILLPAPPSPSSFLLFLPLKPNPALRSQLVGQLSLIHVISSLCFTTDRIWRGKSYRKERNTHRLPITPGFQNPTFMAWHFFLSPHCEKNDFFFLCKFSNACLKCFCSF